jgi:ATP-dependent Lon protease
MCRKPVLMNRDSLNKNITFENIIRAKYPRQYDEKCKANKLAYSQDDANIELKRNNIPTVIINDTYIWPRMKRKLYIQDMEMRTTLTLASVNDRYLVIAPNTDFESDIATLVEITNLVVHEHQIVLEVTGLKRFKIKQFQRADTDDQSYLYISNGEIINDIVIESDDLRNEVVEKLKSFERIHKELLEKAPSSLSRKLTSLYGNIQSVGSDVSTGSLQNISLYYLNLVQPLSHKEDDKKALYSKTNLIERVNW